MPFNIPTLPEVIQRVSNDLASNKVRQSDAQVLSRVHAATTYALYGYQDWIAKQILPDTADEDMLERQAILRLGVGRKPAVASKGYASFTGNIASVVDDNTILQTTDGRQYITTESATVGINGKGQIAIKAIVAGSNGDLDAATQLSLISPVYGVNNTFTITDETVRGGADQESIEALRQRVIRSYRIIPHGGSKDDYVTWALEVPGVTRAWCMPRWLGLGTVGVFFLKDDAADPIPTDEDLAEMQSYLESVRPVTAEVYALRPLTKAINYQLWIDPDTPAVRDAVEKSLRDLHYREAELGSTLLLTHISEAISISKGENDHRIDYPIGNVTSEKNEILIFGGIEWLPR